MTDQTTTATTRRDLLRLGVSGAALAALLAACGKTEAGELGRVGWGESTPELSAGTVDYGVLLRTSASIERSIVEAYQRIIEQGLLATAGPTHPELGDQTALVELFLAHHQAAAETLDGLTTEAGGEPWACGNPRFDEVFIGAAFTRSLEGQPATDAAPAIEPSDDTARDMINLVSTLELLSVATCQAMVPQVGSPAHRVALMTIGARSARQAAHIALVINAGGYLPSTSEAMTTETTVASDEVPQTPIPLPVALPSTYGSLAAITYIGGRGDENGVRQKLNFETPSLNSLVYADATCDA
ncbi:MAG: hypothetical protein ACO3C1_10830 [Ilumatobacteraceae bacterium]